jgi:hypothetical protein
MEFMPTSRSSWLVALAHMPFFAASLRHNTNKLLYHSVLTVRTWDPPGVMKSRAARHLSLGTTPVPLHRNATQLVCYARLDGTQYRQAVSWEGHDLL